MEVEGKRARVVGHTRHALNAFGERVTRDEIDHAVGDVRHFTILPELPAMHECRGRHVWLIEFDVPPADIRTFETAIDASLTAANRDYAKLRHDNWLRPPLARLMRAGAFEQWMREQDVAEVPRVIDAARAGSLLPG